MRCEARVYKRDTYRVSLGGKHKFKMHYTEKQCTRHALYADSFCWQHSTMRNPLRCSWIERATTATAEIDGAKGES